MSSPTDEIRTLDQLTQFVHKTLCARENLVAEQFKLQLSPLLRKGTACGMQFTLHGPRQVKLSAVWAADHNHVYCYDAKGERFSKFQLSHRIPLETPHAA